MKRNIISIDDALCNGCGLCVSACHEGALQLVNGKARLVSESHCDGLGACLPECPTGAIKIEAREAAAFNEAAAASKPSTPHADPAAAQPSTLACGCPGTMAKSLARPAAQTAGPVPAAAPTSSLINWPVQIKLVPVNAPYLKNAALLIAADCTAFAYADIHRRFMANKVTLIGCPKLDAVDYAEKLTAILQGERESAASTVLRMECPAAAASPRRQTSARGQRQDDSWHVVTISTDGAISTNDRQPSTINHEPSTTNSGVT